MGRAVGKDDVAPEPLKPRPGNGLWPSVLVRHRMDYRGGKLRMQRLGHLNAIRQDTHGSSLIERAPARRGIWAFPWPWFDAYFAHHKYWEAMPKRLVESGAYKEIEARYLELKEAIDPDDRAAQYRLEREYDAVLDKLIDAQESERERWIRKVGRTHVPLRQFWFDGDLFTHLNLRGEFQGMDEWSLMSAAQFYEVARKWERRQGVPSEAFEVFIPRSELGGR